MGNLLLFDCCCCSWIKINPSGRHRCRWRNCHWLHSRRLARCSWGSCPLCCCCYLFLSDFIWRQKLPLKKVVLLTPGSHQRAGQSQAFSGLWRLEKGLAVWLVVFLVTQGTTFRSPSGGDGSPGISLSSGRNDHCTRCNYDSDTTQQHTLKSGGDCEMEWLSDEEERRRRTRNQSKKCKRNDLLTGLGFCSFCLHSSLLSATATSPHRLIVWPGSCGGWPSIQWQWLVRWSCREWW